MEFPRLLGAHEDEGGDAARAGVRLDMRPAQRYSRCSDMNGTALAAVSVIIVNWNGEKYLSRCLSALLAQTTRPQEIIVVDNASTDSSPDIVRRFPSIRFLPQIENLGFARGNNLAIKCADSKSEFIVLLNPDAFVEADWLEVLLEAARDLSTADAFASRLVVADEPAILDGAGDVYHISGLIWRFGHGDVVAASDDKVREIFSPCAAAAMYRRSALEDTGGFDEDFFCYVEDVDLGFRLQLAGRRCVYVPKSVAHHVGSGTSGGKHSDFAVYHGHRNLVWAYVKNMPGTLFWLLLPLHLAMNVCALVVFTLRGQGRVIFRAKRDAIMGVSKMWQKRRALQRRRVVSTLSIFRMLSKGLR